MPPRRIALPVATGGGHFQLFSCEPVYKGLLSLFDQLVINNVDTDAKREAAAKFVAGVQAIFREDNNSLVVRKDVSGAARGYKSVVMRPDDTLQPDAVSGVTVWYMLDTTSFATAKAFLEMSTDRPQPAAADPPPTADAARRELLSGKLSAMEWYIQRYDVRANDLCGPQCADLHNAMRSGKCSPVLLNFLVDNFQLKEEAVCGAGHRVVHDLVRAGHKDLVEYLIDKFGLKQGDVCGPNNRAFYAAVLRGNGALLRSLVTIFGMDRPSVGDADGGEGTHSG